MDESGDHGLDKSKIDNLYNVFVLGAVCFENDAYKIFDEAFRKLKVDIFGSDDFIVHTLEVNRPQSSKDRRNDLFKDATFRTKFYDSVCNLIDDTKFHTIACVIKKIDHLKAYGSQANDPYIFSFDNVFNRIFFNCHNKNDKVIEIYPEKRNHLVEDPKLLAHFNLSFTRGTSFIKPGEIQRRLSVFELKDKKENVSGLQLADLLVTPIGRYVMGKTPKPKGNEIPYSLVKRKIPPRCLTVFPQG